MRAFLIIVIIPAFMCCVRTDTAPATGTLAYVPVYASLEDIEPIAIEDPQPTSRPGKIYAYQQYLFQNELYKGIHIIDNSDPAHPVKKAFLKIPFNTDMAIRSNHVYANAINDLVVINMADVLHPQVVSTSKDAFPAINQTHPPEQGYFVCPDPSKGIVVDWVLQNAEKALCRR